MLFHPAIYTIDEVQELCDAAKASLLAGQVVTSWTSLGTSATMTLSIHPLVVLRECTLYLQTVDPDTYGRPVKVGNLTHDDRAV